MGAGRSPANYGFGHLPDFEKNIFRLAGHWPASRSCFQGDWPDTGRPVAGQSIFQKCDFLKKQCSKIFSTKDIDLIFFVTCFLDFEADLTI